MGPAQLFEAIACALGDDAGTERALERTLELLAPALGFDTGWVWLSDPASGRLYLAAAYDLPPYLQAPVEMTGESCWCIEALEDCGFANEPVQTIECSRLRRALRGKQPELATGHRAHASVALRFGSRVLGLMNLSARDFSELDAERAQLLSAVGAQLGIAVDRARLAEETGALARVEERTRMAREIHDTLAQDLAGIALHLESAERNIERDPALAHERLETALGATRGSLERARGSMVTLRADPLGGKPLVSALIALARGFTAETGIVANVVDRAPAALPYAYEVELFRIAAEALSNVRRHAQAHRVQILLDANGPDIELRVEDDGVGYAPPEPAGRFGVTGMFERARLLGGSFSIGSRAPDAGTAVVVRVQLPPVAS